MAKREGQKVKGCKKSGRTIKKAGRVGSAISSFVRNKITAAEYFRQTNQKSKHD
jgi:hypothetical protein